MNSKVTVRSPWEQQKTISSVLDFTILTLFFLILEKYTPADEDGKHMYFILKAMVGVSSITAMASIIMPKKKQQVCVIRHVPYGIQIENYENVFQHANDNRNPNPSKKFISKDSIMDMVVTEVALSYRLLSTVIIRLIQDENDTRGDHPSLVAPFDPDKFELQYNECLLITRAIESIIK